MIQKIRKKPVEIEAIQFNNINYPEIEEFVGKKVKVNLESETAYLAGIAPPQFSLSIDTDRGVMKMFPTDWIIKEFLFGDFYICKNKYFVDIYDIL